MPNSTTPVLHTVATSLLSTSCEVLVWNDGHIEIEDPARNFEDTPTLPHISLEIEKVRKLRAFLNSIEL